MHVFSWKPGLCLAAFLFLLPLIGGPSAETPMPRAAEFNPVEATIADIHREMRTGRLTARQVVEAYLKRIAAYDQPTKLNSLVIVNPKALEEADRLDAEFRQIGRAHV